MSFDRLQVSMDVERNIVLFLIMDTEFCKQIIPVAKPEFFENAWAQVVFGWVKDYFSIYSRAPQKDIRDIFGSKFDALAQDNADLLYEFLAYVNSVADMTIGANLEFHLNRTTDYFKKRSLQVLTAKMQQHLDNGNCDAAENELALFKKVAQGMSTWIKPSGFLDVLQRAIERDEDPLFTFNGHFGKFVGPLQRKWLAYFMGPPKRGKSMGLVETAVQLMTNNVRVAVFSHEMSDIDWISRFINTLVPGATTTGPYLYPIFDCFANAHNTCNQRYRTGNGPCMLHGGPNPAYTPCHVCRQQGDYKQYDNCIAYQVRTVEERTREKMILKAAMAAKWKENYFRFVHYSPYSSSVLDMERDLDRMEYLDGFVADVVLDDYLGAHACGDPKLRDRDVYDFEARHAKRIADVRNLCYISACQGNRGSVAKRHISMSDIAEDIRIVNHSDKILTINQTPEEVEGGIIRIGKAADRHMQWTSEDECTLLQNLKHGRIFMDSCPGSPQTYQQRLASANE